MFVWVRVLTSCALVDTGEHRSPKYTPERIAPPRSAGEICMDVPSVMVMTPMVAADANDEPVNNDIRQFSRNVSRMATWGRIRAVVFATMNGTVPAARHNVVSSPISTKVTTTMLAARMVANPLRIIAPQWWPVTRPWIRKMITPAASAGTMDMPLAMQPISAAQNRAMVMNAAIWRVSFQSARLQGIPDF